jgi:hypothetical protein
MMTAKTAKMTFFAMLGVFVVVVPCARGETLPQVSSRHPRIYVRADGARLGKGLTANGLRRRAGDPAYARWRRPLSRASLGAMVERAARYLETGSPDDLDAVRQYLLTHTFSQREHDVGGLLAGADMATAFDWVYAGVPASDRTAILSNIATTADSSYEFLIHGQPDVNHNYTYMALRTIAICGMVMKGEGNPFDRKAVDYLKLAREWLEGPGRVLDTWKAREGVWAEGSHYTFHETVRTLIMMLHAYRTATDTDYLGRIEKGYGNFVARAGRFLIACTRPDLTFERTGDVLPSRALASITVPLTVEMLASGLSDGAEKSRLRSFSRALCEAYGEKALDPSFNWGMRMFSDARAPLTPSFRTLPLAMRLGAGTDEHIVFRNGWNVDSTQITILAGSHYTDHQHFDKGSFLIYHGGGLAVDSGTYDSMYKAGGHWNNYATRTLAHNCLLVYDPGEPMPAGYANDGGQLVLRGLQHHGDWQSYLNHAEKEKLRAARVTAFEADGRLHHYVRCDLASAYGDKVRSYEREFAYLPDADFLVVLDRVRAATPEFKKLWLLHFQDRPVIHGASLVEVRRSGELDLGHRVVRYDGSLLLRTLLPENRTVTAVGGPGFEYFNPFTGVNYPPETPGRASAPRESGTWRIEVSPAEAAADDLFLNAFQFAAGSDQPVAEVRALTGERRDWVGLQLMARPMIRVMLFSGNPDGAAIPLPLRYGIDSDGPARHLILNLPAGEKVSIRVNGKPLAAHAVSPSGILSFEDRSKGGRTIEIGR